MCKKMKIGETFAQSNTQIRNFSSKLMICVIPYPPVMNTVTFLHIQHGRNYFFPYYFRTTEQQCIDNLVFLFFFSDNNK